MEMIEKKMTDKTFTVYFIRHGLTFQNLCREYQGSLLNNGILPESEMLIKQREARGASPLISSLWVSPLRRARHTAELYFPGKEYNIMPELLEREFGRWDGMTYDDLKDDGLYQEFLNTFGKVTPPGGEPYDQFETRLNAVIGRIENTARTSPERFPLALVFHGGPILYLSSRLIPENEQFWRYAPPGAGGLKLELALDPLRAVAVEELFTDDIPVERTPFYLDYKKPR